MRQRRRKVIPVPRTQHTHLPVHGQFHRATRDQAAFFAFGMHDRLFAGAGAGGVLFAEQAHLTAGDRGADEQQAQAVAAEVGLFVGAEYVLMFARGWSKVKKSARDIGMPSSSFFSELTEGLTRFCSISEMVALVTPLRRASSRWESL